MLLLIAFRVVQGAGGAALFPLSLALIFTAFPPAERGLANGVLGIPVLFAPAMGPVLGGYLVQFIDWRWIFYVNVPIGIAGVVLGARVLPESPRRRDVRFDLRGFVLLAAGLALLLYGTSNLAYDGWSDLMTVSGPIVVAALLLLLYIPTALRTPVPLLDLRLFRERNFWTGNLIIWLATVGLFGPAFLLPQYLQTLRGLDPYDAGLRQLPLGLAAIVGTVLAGALYNRVGPRLLIVAGALAMTVDTYLLGQWSTLDTALAVLTPLLIVRGLALSPLLQTANTLTLQNISPPALPGASTLSVVTRNVVASLAVAALTTILQTQTIVHDVNLSAQGGLSNPSVAALYNRLVATFSAQGLALQQADSAALHQVMNQISAQARVLAYQDVYLLTTLVLVPAVVLPLLLRARQRATSQGQGVPDKPTAVMEV
jgi:DHA2 family multidrug resistance protein